MVEERQDKTNQCGQLISMAERTLFNTLKTHLQVSHNPRSPSSHKFSWDNLQTNGSMILAHLDRVYLFRSSANFPRRIISYRICGDSAWSNHLSIEAYIELEVGHHRSHWQMNTSLLDEAKFHMKQVWNAQPQDASFFTKIKLVTKYYK